MNADMPTLRDVYAARENVYRYLKPTPLYSYGTLNEVTGLNLYVKHENHQPVGRVQSAGRVESGSWGWRTREREAGLYTASTGNHGQSSAYAARANGIKASVAVPEGANPCQGRGDAWIGGRRHFSRA